MNEEQKGLDTTKKLGIEYYDFKPMEKENCEYSKMLKSYIEDGCKSIGLIGGYATGKSSIIETYIQHNKETECLIISSATFKQQNIDEISYIQKVFITQLLAELGEEYYIDKNYHLKKRHKFVDKYQENNVFELYVLSVIYLITTFFDFGLNNELLMVLKIILVLFVITYSTKLILDVIYDANITKSFSKISIKNLKLEADDNSGLKLEEHITKDMHIITVMIQELKKQKTNKLVIFIEDIDRYIQNDIFNSLYHINKVIEKLDVHFVYALGTDIGIEDMTKYFDAIIDVIPFYDQYNAAQYVNKLLNHPLDVKFLNKIMYYIDDYRLTKRIVNLYKFYETNYPSKESEVMFCLATLKIKFPNYLVVTPGIQGIEKDYLKVIIDEVHNMTLDNNSKDFKQIFLCIVNAERGYEEDKTEVQSLLDTSSDRSKTQESLDKIQTNYKLMKEKLKTDYNLIEFMILEGYLDEKYNWYMSVSSNSYSPKDQDFISSILNKHGTFNLSHNADSLSLIYDNYITTQNVQSDIMLLTQQFFDFILNTEKNQIDNLITNMIANKKVIDVFSELNSDTIIEIYKTASPRKLTSILESLENDKFLTIQNLETIKFENYYKRIVSNLSSYKEVLTLYFQDVLAKNTNDNELRNILYTFTLSDFTLEIGEDLLYILKDEKLRFNYVQEEQIFMLTHLENKSIKTKFILSGNVIKQVLNSELLSKQDVIDYTTFYLVNNELELLRINFNNEEINKYIDFLSINEDNRIDKILELMDPKSYFINDYICENLSSTEKEIVLKRRLFQPQLSSFIKLYNSLGDKVVLQYEDYKENVIECIREGLSKLSEIECKILENFLQQILVNGTKNDLTILDLLISDNFRISNLNIDFQDSSIEVRKRIYNILAINQISFDTIVENDQKLISHYINSDIEDFIRLINIENYETLSLLIEDENITLDIKKKIIQNYNVKPIEEDSQLKISNSHTEELVLELLKNQYINLCFKEVDEYRIKNDSNSGIILEIIGYLAEYIYLDSNENCYAKDSFKEKNLERFVIIWNKIKNNDDLTFDQCIQILSDNYNLLIGNFSTIIEDSKFKKKFIKVLEVVNSSNKKARREIPIQYYDFPLEVKKLIKSEVKVGDRYFTKKHK